MIHNSFKLICSFVFLHELPVKDYDSYLLFHLPGYPWI